jgi:EAL domain-containing protein (putative c-di-GMP-specific phosphodiesterase class I)/ActR/RegA family two-component response regulator
MHLLVLDDDVRIVTFIASVASEKGWSVDTSTSEREFHKLYTDRLPDVIMLDLQLGISDGVEQLRFLRQENYDGVVVVMSGFDSRVLAAAQQLGESLGLCITNGLQKPMRAVQVRAVLEEAERRMPINVGNRDLSETSGRTHAPELEELTPSLIAEAIGATEMELFLQPIISATDYSVAYCEALIRWNHPTHGMIPPNAFISIAEQDEAVIDQLTTWIIGAAIEHYKRLIDVGFDIPISINVSGKNLHSLDFPDRLSMLIDQAQVSPEALSLEITESVAMHDPRQITDIMTRLRLHGFKLAMDDFGTGYSSLMALRQMPFSSLKVDQSFVNDLLVSQDAYTIVKSVIDLSKNMGLKSVAEGVETEAIASMLIRLGIDELQGYYFSRPLPFAKFEQWVKMWPHKSKSLE